MAPLSDTYLIFLEVPRPNRLGVGEIRLGGSAGLGEFFEHLFDGILDFLRCVFSF